MIPFFKHNLNKNKNYLLNTLNSSYLTSGPVCEKVENLILKKFKKKFAILTNISSITDDDTSITNFEGNPIKLYLLDDLNPTKEGTSDTYFLATFNIKKNDFSNYIVTSATNEIRIVDRVSKNNPYHRWVVEKVGTGLYTAGNYKGDENNTFDEISIISAANTGTGIAKKHLNQVYDSNAKSKFELLSTGSGGNWRYDSYLKGKLPNYKE